MRNEEIYQILQGSSPRELSFEGGGVVGCREIWTQGRDLRELEEMYSIHNQQQQR